MTLGRHIVERVVGSERDGRIPYFLNIPLFPLSPLPLEESLPPGLTSASPCASIGWTWGWANRWELTLNTEQPSSATRIPFVSMACFPFLNCSTFFTRRAMSTRHASGRFRLQSVARVKLSFPILNLSKKTITLFTRKIGTYLSKRRWTRM